MFLSPLNPLVLIRMLTRRQQGSDPGVKLSIYWPPVTNYQIPGPKVFTC
jgi:hypothetical protein